jgi:hypothetical protein
MNTNRPAGQGTGPVHAAAACFVLLLALLIPPNLRAQEAPPWTGYDSDGKAVAAILPFVGDRETAAQFNAAVVQAVSDLGTYSPREVSRETVESLGLRIPTDMPPVRELVPGARYALTGGVYAGDEDIQSYIQLWLWDITSSIMIYSDDLVYDNTDNALENLPGLVEWLFSHIVEQTAEVETVEETGWDDYWIHAGIRSGLSQHWYTAPDESIPGAYSLTFEGGLFMAVRLNSRISVQVEADFIWDDLVYRGIDDTSSGSTYNPVLANERRYSFSLLFPLLFKVNFRPGSFQLSPYGGIFVFAPLGKANYSRYPDGKAESFSWSPEAPLGFSVGFEAARKLGPGVLSADIRYLGDFSNIAIHDGAANAGGSETVYRRSMLSFSIGYSFGFVSIKK